MIPRVSLLVIAALFAVSEAPAESTPTSPAAWVATQWKGEAAFESVHLGWRAVISTIRGRLVYFGPSDSTINLLYVPEKLDHPVGWGGHRVWLGPQAAWAEAWPPLKAWEKSHAAVANIEHGTLRLTMPESGAGWGRVIREYAWQENELRCNVATRGGSRPAQVIQILQVPRNAVVYLRPTVAPDAPNGYVQVHLGRNPSPNFTFDAPPHVQRESDGRVSLHFRERSEKLAFRPQPIEARVGGFWLRMRQAAQAPAPASELDAGYSTQVYLGDNDTPLIELEQLSPQYEAGRSPDFVVAISAEKVAR